MIAFEKIRATAPRKGSIWDYKTKVKFMSWSKVLPQKFALPKMIQELH